MGMRPSGVAKMMMNAMTSHHGWCGAHGTPAAAAMLMPSMVHASQVAPDSVMATSWMANWAARVPTLTGFTRRFGRAVARACGALAEAALPDFPGLPDLPALPD